MAIIKVIKLMASSPNSWEEATKNAVAEASKSVKNIKSAYVQEQSAVVNGNDITEYRVNVKVSFVVD